MWIATRKGPTQLIRSRHYFDGEWHVLLCKYCGFAFSRAENDTMGSMLELGGVETENFRPDHRGQCHNNWRCCERIVQWQALDGARLRRRLTMHLDL